MKPLILLALLAMSSFALCTPAFADNYDAGYDAGYWGTGDAPDHNGSYETGYADGSSDADMDDGYIR